jgi:hypothetical protein
MKNQLPIDSRERSLKELIGESYRGHYSDEELHLMLQRLIDSDHRLIVELHLTAWDEAHTLNAGEKQLIPSETFTLSKSLVRGRRQS